VPNWANVAKHHCFPKNVQTFLEIFFNAKFCHFLKCEYWQNDPFWIIYQMSIIMPNARENAVSKL